jgi:hypothetical protein
MSNNNVDLSLLKLLKNRKTASPSEEDIQDLVNTLNALLDVEDFKGLLHVIEVLRILGDDITINADCDEISIQCTQIYADRENVGPKNDTLLSTMASQEVVFKFDYDPDKQTYSSYVNEVADVAKNSVMALHRFGPPKEDGQMR